MNVPYIGITDFTSAQEARRMLATWYAHRQPGSVRKLMIGVMMSYKTLNGLPTKWASVFPPAESIKDIFIAESLALNTLHYADYEGIDTLSNIVLATEYGGEHLHALQLDMLWPRPTDLQVYRSSYPNIAVLLQVSATAMEHAQNDPALVTEWLKVYGSSIDYVLFDKSMGRGKGMDSTALKPFIEAAAAGVPHLGIAVAGGLGPSSMHLLGDIPKNFPNISIDAQGQLRPSGSALDPIDWDMAAEYIRRASNILK